MFNNNYNIFNDLNNSSDEEENQKEFTRIRSWRESENCQNISFQNDVIISNGSKEYLRKKDITNFEEEKYIIENLDDIEENLTEDLEDEDEKKYIEPKILENISLNNFFSKDDILKAKNNNKKLQITDKGLYSITKSDDAVWITNLILKFIKNETTLHPKNTTIIDSTSGIGGNSIHFCKYFNKVNSIEINEIHYNVLKNNIDALNIKNINIYHNNFLNLVNTNKLGGDIFFIDPPWGGKSYKNFKYFFLKIGKLPLINVLNILYESKYKYVVLKAPYNLNVSLLIGTTKYDNINIYKNSKKNMLIIIFY